MTKLLQDVISEISMMPESEQNNIAELLYEELAWQKSFDNSQDQLKKLASEATNEYKQGKTKPLDLLL